MIHLRRAAAGLLGAAALLASATPPASAATLSGTDTRTVSSRVLSSASPFYQKLPDATPAAADSAAVVSSLDNQAHVFYGTATDANVSVNTVKYTPPMYVARNTDPLYDVTAWSCQASTAMYASLLNEKLQDVRIPADAVPDPTDDGSMAIYNPDTKDLVELWKARKVNGQWQACWGGRLSDADQTLGVFDKTFGASASGMAMWPTTIRAAELRQGHIDHVIGLSIPYTKAGVFSWPALRTDGWKTGSELAIGQMLRLPASVDIDAMKLSPLARTIAKAAQEYGIIVTDTGGAVAFAAENAAGLATNPYPDLFRGRWSFQEMMANKSLGEQAFPLDKLVALPVDYRVPVAVEPTPGPTTPPADYRTTILASHPSVYWRLDETGAAVADSSGNNVAGTMTGVYRPAPGVLTGDTAVATYGNDRSLVYANTKVAAGANATVQVWFKANGLGKGGKLAGFESSQTALGTGSDRSLYMLNDGRLAFGTMSPSAQAVTSTRKYNDGVWHFATATQSGTGTVLYVDAVRVATGTATGGPSATGYWRLGGGNLAAWPNRPTNSYFAGSLDEFAVYGSALDAATVTAQYKARS
jgi:hypothetical protein